MDELESRPPVPPKDTPQRQFHHLERSSASATKRKHLEAYADESEFDIDYENTPKRHRLTPSGDDTSPRRQNTLRRKKGVNNLSTLSLRHEAERARLEEKTRESKFQEGSLTDKPSQRPPSAFINFTPAEHIDTLMTEYHDGMPTPEESVHDVESTQHSSVIVEQPSALYRFGQRLASSFRPAAMLSKFWNESREDLIQKNLEAERKRRQKEEAERQYTFMQQTGQIPRKRSSFGFGSVSQRDSGIAMYDGHSSKRSSTAGLARDGATSRTGASSRAESHTPNEPDGDKTLRGRLHFKRPSLSNLRMKRTKSDANLFGTVHDSFTSISPVKTDEEHVLQKSPSKADLRKQRKLSKRVSDLELQLHIARQELNEAMVEASPMPQAGRYMRATAARKFVPGLLPSLPSERLLMAEAVDQNGGAKRHDDETIRASRVNYPRRATELFDDLDSEDELPVHKADKVQVERRANTVTSGDLYTDRTAVDAPEDVTNKHTSLAEQEPTTDKSANAASIRERRSMEQEQSLSDDEDDANLDDNASRLSIDSTTRSLEPVYEEEEDTVNIPLNGDPMKPTATATPARFGRFTRSMSPVKHNNVRPGAEEIVITRAADAARQHPGRQTSRSPAKDKPFEWPEDVF